MKIKNIQVKNFRLLRDFNLDVEDNLTLIIGKNNTGKTSLLTLLTKLLNNDNPDFSFDDFNLKSLSKLEDIDEENLSEDFQYGIEMKICIEYTDADNFSIVSPFMMNLSPDENFILLRFRYGLDYQRALLAKKDYDAIEEKKPFFIEFIESNYNNYFRNERHILEYGKESNSRPLDNNRELNRLINLKSISAKRNVDNQSPYSSAGDKSLSKMASTYYEKIENDETKVDKVVELKEKLRVADIGLTASFETTFVDIISKVKKYSGFTDDGIDIKILSTLEEKNILKDNTTVKYIQDGRELPEDYNGLGYMNLFELIFQIEVILNDFKKFSDVKTEPSGINLLFIEEPEAHTHPQMQYIFIKNIKKLLEDGKKLTADETIDLQTIITTHSSHITSESDFSDIKYFYKDEVNSGCKVKNLKALEDLYEADPKHYQFLKQYLTITRAELFFAEKVILIEGDTERILMPTIMKKMDLEEADVAAVPLLSQNISIVEVGAYAQIFEKFIDFLEVKKTLIITDIDSGASAYSNEARRVTSAEADISTNSAIKEFFKTNSLPDIKLKSLEQKTLSKKEQVGGTREWIEDADGNLCLVYQTEDEGKTGRSFEEAFFNLAINKTFVTKKFHGIKNYRHFLDNTKDEYDLAEHCINKKTYFALDIIYHSDASYSNWQIPSYIKEGLLWLKK